MSERQVIATLRAALQDAAIGFAPTVAAVLAAEGIAAGIVTTEYNFVRWIGAEKLAAPSMGHEVAIYPSTSRETLELPLESLREGLIDLTLTFTTFHSDAGVIEDNILVHAAALRRVLDRLREFSDANGGTVAQVVEPITVDFLTNAGAATSAGFRARFTIEERSTV